MGYIINNESKGSFESSADISEDTSCLCQGWKNSVYGNAEQDVQLQWGGCEKKTVIYARVSTGRQKNDLQNRIEQMKQWCFMNGNTISAIYSHMASGISFEKRKGFFEMPDEIMDHRVEKVVITYKDRLGRVGFELFLYISGSSGLK